MISIRIFSEFRCLSLFSEEYINTWSGVNIDNGDVLTELVWEFHHFCVDQLIPFN